MNVQKILEEMGLNKSKGTVYMAALETGTGSVQDISKRAKLPRTTVHEILQHLCALGLVTFINKGRTRIYTVEPPEKLKVLLQEKERKLEAALPELASFFRVSAVRPRVRFYEGVEGVKTVFEDTLTVGNKLLLGFLSMEDLYKVPGKEYMDEYVRRRVGRGIELQVIRSRAQEIEETWPGSIKENRELHYAPQDMIFPTTMYIYDQKIGIIGTEKEQFGMIVESPGFYQTQKNLFEFMWQNTRTANQ